MKKYEDVLIELEELRIWAYSGDYFDIRGRLLEVHYRGFFEFGQEFLDRDFKHFKIHPARMFFDTEPVVNACARKCKGYSLVEICQGTITGLVNLFSGKDSRFDVPLLIRIRDFILGKGTHPGPLMVQFLWQYVFYHEVGHLVQYTARPEFNRVEFLGDKLSNEEVLSHHLHEMDADWFASYHLALHITQLLELKNVRESGEDENTADLTALAVAAIFVFFIDQRTLDPAIYFSEHRHPHASVRLTYMVYFVLENLESVTPVRLDKLVVVRKAAAFSEALMLEGNKNLAADFNRVRLEHAGEITGYIKMLMGKLLTEPTMTINILRKRT